MATKDWSIVRIACDKKYLVTPLSGQAHDYARRMLRGYEQLKITEAYIIPEDEINAHFGFVEE